MTDHKEPKKKSSTRTNMEPAARDHDIPSADNLLFRLKPLAGGSVKTDVLSGLGEIKVVKGDGIIGETLSIEEEMEFLRNQREAWNS